MQAKRKYFTLVQGYLPCYSYARPGKNKIQNYTKLTCDKQSTTDKHQQLLTKHFQTTCADKPDRSKKALKGCGKFSS